MVQAVQKRAGARMCEADMAQNTGGEGMNKDKLAAYWRKNLGFMVILLSIWFLVSYVFGIIFVQELNSIHLAGFPLGFWFAQQGSIYVFVALIFVYVGLMNRLDREYDVHE
jgi:putative solute:sodium symporter small subunit